MLTAGQELRASTCNRFQPVRYSATASADLAAGLTDTDITGASVTLTTQTNGARYTVTATLDVDLTGATTTIVRGKLVVDGTAVRFGEALYQAEVGTDRMTVYQQWNGVLPTKGQHTFKLRGTTPANATIRATHTNIFVKIREVI